MPSTKGLTPLKETRRPSPVSQTSSPALSPPKTPATSPPDLTLPKWKQDLLALKQRMKHDSE